MRAELAPGASGILGRLPLGGIAVLTTSGLILLFGLVLLPVRRSLARDEAVEVARLRLEAVAGALAHVPAGELHAASLASGLAADARVTEGPAARASSSVSWPDGVPSVTALAPVAGGRTLTIDQPIGAEVDAAGRRALRHAASALLLALVLIALVSLSLSWLVSRYVRELADVVRRTAAGDLTGVPGVPSIGRELSSLGEGVAGMQRGIADLATEMNETVQLLDESVMTLQQATGAQSRTISQQAATLQETQVTAQEIKQTSTLAAARAEAVLQVADRARELGLSGEVAIEQSLGTLTSLRAQVEEIARTIQALGDRSRQIGGITLSVKDLADQSNMLALNAAIEAVRSGEHGRSFAVVAREIRSLADSSIQATRQVRSILADISSAVGSAVSITETGATRMEQGLAEMKSFGENFRELASIVKEDADAVRQIAAAVSQQNAGVTQIFAALTDQMRMMDETVSRVASTDVAAAALKEISQGVLEMARRYKVETKR